MNTFTAAMAAMQPEKLESLRRLIGDDQRAALLSSLDNTHRKAMAAGIAYKTTRGPAKWSLDDLSGYLRSHPNHWF